MQCVYIIFNLITQLLDNKFALVDMYIRILREKKGNDYRFFEVEFKKNT